MLEGAPAGPPGRPFVPTGRFLVAIFGEESSKCISPAA
jgi:hypothetical protein